MFSTRGEDRVTLSFGLSHANRRMLDLMGKLEWDKSFDYKAERSRS